MRDPLTTISLICLTLIALAASVWGVLQLYGSNRTAGTMNWHARIATWLIAAGSAAVFLYRWVWVNHAWVPVEAHVDGLLLIVALIAALALYLQARARLPGLLVFVLPLMAFLLAWGICASMWTFHAFKIHSVWKALHLTSVYLGSLFCLISAVAGAMFLLVNFRLRHKRDPAQVARIGSLETIERTMVHTAAAGFALLTLALISGLMLAGADGLLRQAGWWSSPKIILATAVWALCALIMNVRHVGPFRGTRAAALSLACLVLLLATMALANGMTSPSAHPPATQHAPLEAP